MKAIHNKQTTIQTQELLWTIHKDTKNESNSQLLTLLLVPIPGCELYTKIQKMKAIHNQRAEYLGGGKLWTIHKDTKNESNSQQFQNLVKFQFRCELYTKIQKMKAIHN